MTPRMLWGPQDPRQTPLPPNFPSIAPSSDVRGGRPPVDKRRLGGLELLEVRTVQRVSILLRGAGRLDKVVDDLCASEKTWELHG
jgi:hypothetical protein